MDDMEVSKNRGTPYDLGNLQTSATTDANNGGFTFFWINRWDE